MKTQLKYYKTEPGMVAFSTTRHGGYSEGQYGEFNINPYCGDNPESISKNINLLSTEIDIPVDRIIMPHQTHGTEVRLISDDFFSLSTATKSMILEGVDALITSVNGVCIGVSTADCIPILLYDPTHKVIAAVHAGWRGTLKRIVCKTIAMLHQSHSTLPSDLRAIIGPGISAEAFEVGDEVYEQFRTEAFQMDAISWRRDKWHIDLSACNCQQMESSGVKKENIQTSNICTFNHSDDYFSARRLGINSGRIFTAIYLKQ